MRVRLSSAIEFARSRALSGVSPWIWVRKSSRSAFWRRMRSTRTLPTASRINLNPGPASTGCCCWVSPAKTIFAPWRSESLRIWCAWRVDNIPASSTMMVVSLLISMPPRAARRSSLSTQNGRASTSLPNATAVRQATAVAIMLCPCSRLEIGDGPQCRGLARACRPFDDGDPALG